MGNSTTVPNEPQVEWRDIPGYETVYQVSDAGQIKRIAPGNYSKSDIRRQSINKKGYALILLRNNGIQRCFRVHRLVMLAFAGECPMGIQVNHINGIKADNRRSNLEYVTPKENCQHAIKVLGSALIGGHNGSAKLNAEKVREIRRLYARGISHKDIANQFNVHRSSISLIIEGKTWQHVC